MLTAYMAATHFPVKKFEFNMIVSELLKQYKTESDLFDLLEKLRVILHNCCFFIQFFFQLDWIYASFQKLNSTKSFIGYNTVKQKYQFHQKYFIYFFFEKKFSFRFVDGKTSPYFIYLKKKIKHKVNNYANLAP